MNYRHIFHAGNFADVVKHLILLSILKNLHKKEKPFHVLDAFAGIGLYDLKSESSNKSSEYKNGILKLLEYKGFLPELLEEYKKIASNFYTEKMQYPGSPIIISKMLRESDRADFCELHPEDFKLLKYTMKKSSNNISCHMMDGFISSKSLLPPKERRGLVLIDPPYEKKDEFEKVFEFITITSKHYSQASIAIWYPIKNLPEIKKFYSNISSLNREFLKIEFAIKDSPTALNKIGMLILNPPYISKLVEDNLKFLVKEVYSGNASFILSSNI